MLVKLTVENYKSFDQKEELNLISSSKIQSNKSHQFRIKQTTLLKHAVIYGANASGKSNLVSTLGFIKEVLIEGLPASSVNDFCKNRIENKERDSIFEIQFTVGNNFYAYGFSALLSKKIITEEWLYELKQNGSYHNLFSREADNPPTLGDGVNPSETEKNRFSVYSEDFSGHKSQLFLTEMNRGKKYEENSKLMFFADTFRWIINNVVVINPRISILNTDTFYESDSLESISQLIRTFDTGVSEIKTTDITPEDMSKILPPAVIEDIIDNLKQQMQITNLPMVQTTLRFENGFFNIRMRGNEEPKITTLVLKHGKSLFDFSFFEESDGTKRLFDLIDMIMTKKEDVVFVVDELERSLHPKLTERFLNLFMLAHENKKMQLIFTTHEDTIMNQTLFRRDEIWFVERNANNASKIYSLDVFKERYDKTLGKAYLEGRYGAIPVFGQFSFKEG